ncbi:hypothetical protein Tco_1173160 [Tanacetum coccineum]
MNTAVHDKNDVWLSLMIRVSLSLLCIKMALLASLISASFLKEKSKGVWLGALSVRIFFKRREIFLDLTILINTVSSFPIALQSLSGATMSFRWWIIASQDETIGHFVHPKDATSIKMVCETLSHADAKSMVIKIWRFYSNREFDEYFEQSTDSEPVPAATVLNAPIVSTNTSVSTMKLISKMGPPPIYHVNALSSPHTVNSYTVFFLKVLQLDNYRRHHNYSGWSFILSYPVAGELILPQI